MIREIVQLGDKVLRETCAPVEKFDEELWVLLDDMKETLKKAQGAGLAAEGDVEEGAGRRARRPAGGGARARRRRRRRRGVF